MGLVFVFFGGGVLCFVFFFFFLFSFYEAHTNLSSAANLNILLILPFK